MKAPTIIWAGTTTGGSNGRNISSAIRKILITETLQEDAKHVLRMKSVKGGEFMVDYMEFIPREILEFEGID